MFSVSARSSSPRECAEAVVDRKWRAGFAVLTGRRFWLLHVSVIQEFGRGRVSGFLSWDSRILATCQLCD